MIYLFLAEGFEEIEALTPIDLLRRAGLSVTVVGVGGDVVRGAHGITVTADIPDTMYADAAPELLILPGGMPGTLNLKKSPVVTSAVRAAVRKGLPIAAICAAPMILGHMGLLDGKRAVSYPSFEKDLLGATVTGARVERDGNIVTAVGMGAATEFGLSLVELLCGKEKADEIARAVLAK